jgi:hypothetical protein
MIVRARSVLASLVLACTIALPATAAVSPYVRLQYGGNQLRMTDGNLLIKRTQATFQSAGYPAEFQSVGPGSGPGGSVGLWLFRGFRVGATYSHFRAVRHNRLHVPGQVFYADDLDFRMTEIGGEAAVRFQKLAGLTLGASVARGKAEMIEGYSYEDLSGQLYLDATANRTRTTFGAFVGLDQTNPAGVAGFIRVGFEYRDMGHMPSQVTLSDGTTTSNATGRTIWLDYSGIYVRAGIGYDLVR